MDITEKKYKKLSIQVSLSGLSFCCFDTLNNTISSFNELLFDTIDKGVKIEDLFSEAFQKHPELKQDYDEVSIIHYNNLSTFVPTALFDENFLGSYLQYNTKVFDTDFFAFDEIETYDINTVYIPYVNMNNYFIDKFGAFDYKHANTILLTRLMQLSKNNDSKTMWVHFAKGHFEIVVIQNQKLLLFNSFEYATAEDFLYYLLFTAEQLNMNPENFALELIGDIHTDSAFYKIAYKYVRNINLIDVEDLRWNNYFSEAENRKHFILFNS
ncbi:DUF3822 family protein [Flavobacterium algicola]|uniref:DUF3822 family protein n=1 Tax=Flavobacterium algicola TaxID=556529 RepID=UPI001EFD9C1F|nr:DUF3822 family protein [Flavobacterium algicola]MCG9793638.1 DUF3822 family protein [Flavobacterium algicola]